MLESACKDDTTMEKHSAKTTWRTKKHRNPTLPPFLRAPQLTGGAQALWQCNHRKALSQNKFKNKNALQRPTLPPLPARTSTHRRRAWGLRMEGLGFCMDFDSIWHIF